MTKRLIAVAVVAVSTGAAIGLALPASECAQPDTQVAAFTFCHTGGGQNCVVDADTIWLNGEKIRIADIDAPETHQPKCPSEAELGRRATVRMHALLNEGGWNAHISPQ